MPLQVVQAKATIPKPSFSISGNRPASFGNDGIDFFIGRPNVFQADFLAVCNAEYVVFNIETDTACQRVGNDQRRRSEESLFRIRVDTAVEVAVA